MERTARRERNTNETRITGKLNIDGSGMHDISTGIPLFDHMLTLFCVHGFFDLDLKAKGDVAVDSHHTIEDVGLVLGGLFYDALGDKSGIRRYGFAATPMDEVLCQTAVDFSGRPYLVYMVPETVCASPDFSAHLAKEFFLAFTNSARLNLHINALYGENDHHVIEAVFKSFARAVNEATQVDPRIRGVRSSKGVL